MAQLKMWKFKPTGSTTEVGSYYNSTNPSDVELFSEFIPTTNTWDSSFANKLPNYNSVTVQKYFPRKVGHTLLDGGFTTFTPNTKHRITMQFSFLTPAQYEIILTNFIKKNINYPTLNSYLISNTKVSKSKKKVSSK